MKKEEVGLVDESLLKFGEVMTILDLLMKKSVLMLESKA